MLNDHYLLMFSPSGFEEFLRATAVPAPGNASAPTEPPAVAVRNVRELAADYGIKFGCSDIMAKLLLPRRYR